MTKQLSETDITTMQQSSTLNSITAPDSPRVVYQGRPVTMQDIADLCEVSLITVSRALRFDERVRPETAERIQRAATKLGYNPALHQAARRLALRKHGLDVLNHVIALFIGGDALRSLYFTHILRGVMTTASQGGFALLTADAMKGPGQNTLLPIYARGDVDGYLFLGWTYATIAPLFEQLRTMSSHRAYPMVSLLAPAPGCTAVTADDRGGAYAAVDHLLSLGHRYILHFWGNALPVGENYFQDERRAGCEQACRDHGVDPQVCLRSTTTSGATPLHERVSKPLDVMLDRHPEITAIVLPNDAFAQQANEVLKSRRYRVPETMSLVGFDDTEPLPDDMGRNMLTTVHLPLEEIGAAAAQLLIANITGQTTPEAPPPLPASLIVRASTAPPHAR